MAGVKSFGAVRVHGAVGFAFCTDSLFVLLAFARYFHLAWNYFV